MASGGFADEDEFIKPKLFTDFLKEILGFPSDEYIPEHDIGVGAPDFQPRDTLSHKFFFEVKGSDFGDLTIHRSQVMRYLKPPFIHGVLTNMRDVLVYDVKGLQVMRVGLLELYADWQDHRREVLEYPNTRCFLEFVVQFHHQFVDRAKKIELIKNAQPPNMLPKADLDKLVQTIHKVVTILTDDARQFRSDFETGMNQPFNKPRRQSVLAELQGMARELHPGYKPRGEDALQHFLKARSGSVEHRAFQLYLTRVAYFTMTKILLARVWEDIGFLEQSLYDGGFRIWYERLGQRIQKVLDQAFMHARSCYAWLYGSEHNYYWYDPPSEEAIIDVLYELAHFNLGSLDADVLGTVYEHFVDRIDCKNKG